LVEIFENCSPSSEHLISAVATPAEETDRLAKKYLLQLSQVRPSPLPIFYCFCLTVKEGVLALARHRDEVPEVVV
jgi:hypothetical protein